VDVIEVVEQVEVEVVMVVVESSLVDIYVEALDLSPLSQWILSNKQHRSILQSI
jgi:hypothetical protein